MVGVILRGWWCFVVVCGGDYVLLDVSISRAGCALYLATGVLCAAAYLRNSTPPFCLPSMTFTQQWVINRPNIYIDHDLF